MRSKVVLFSLFLLTFFLSSFALDKVDDANISITTNDQVDNVSIIKDGQILAYIITLNKNEIATANEITKRKVNPLVKEYASKVRTEHSKSLQESLKLGTKIGVSPVETRAVILLTKRGVNEITQLRNLDNPKFQVVFIEDMVKDHEDALKKIDQGLSNVTNPELKQHLQLARATVANHLQEAKEIQDKLKSGAKE